MNRNQPTLLFDVPHSHRNDPMSSYRAGDRAVRSGRMKGQMAAVLRAVKQYPNRTSAELARLSGMDRYTPARRLAVLERRGLVKRGKERKCAVCGSQCITWYPTQQPGFFGEAVN